MKQMILKMMCILGSALFLFGAAAAEPAGDPLRVTFFDVGKGDCILVSRGGCSVMIDTGYAETADNVAAAMRQQGIDHLDALILTHYDRDHVAVSKPSSGPSRRSISTFRDTTEAIKYIPPRPGRCSRAAWIQKR